MKKFDNLFIYLQVINEHLKILMTEADIFALLSKSQEFEQIKVCFDMVE